jgi:NADPH:quinone reductase-like Zn-dependent oxidoreductase
VRELGADIVVDRSRANPLAGASSYDVFFDAAAAYTYAACRRLIAQRGSYVTTLPSVGLFVGMVLGPLSGKTCAVLVVESKRSDLERLGRWISEGLRIPIAARYRVREAASAVRRAVEGRKLGRIVVQVEGGW